MALASTQSSSNSSPHHLRSSVPLSARDSAAEVSLGYFNVDNTTSQCHNNNYFHKPSMTPSFSKMKEPPSSSASALSSSSQSITPSNSQGFQRSNVNLKPPSYKPFVPEVMITLAGDAVAENIENKNTSTNNSNNPLTHESRALPNSPVAASSFNLPHRFGTNLNAKSVDIKTLGVHEIDNLDELKKLRNEQVKGTADLLIIDTRPFNQYSISRIKNALSICVPSTLLKRSSFNLANIFKTMTAQQQESIDTKLQSANNLNIVFYDLNSNSEQCSFHLFQILKKFQSDISQYDKKIEMHILNNGFTSFVQQDGISKESVFDFKKLKSTNSADSFAHFALPSADPSAAFLLSIKKNHVLPNENSSFVSNSINLPKFDHPENLPTWIQSYLSPNSVKMVIRNFVKIEDSENARIESSVSQKKHSPSICSPSCLCPSCDELNYNLLNGSEHGYKNRYPNILPYEHSRVKLVESPLTVSPSTNNLLRYFPKLSPNNVSPNNSLKLQYLIPASASSSSNEFPSVLIPDASAAIPCCHGTNHDDYFNANFINVPQINEEARYIATQAPLPSTIDDFWKVIWHNNSEIIISLTNLTEKGMKKSDIYWENSNQVKLLREYENYKGLENLTVRKIQLTRKKKSRIITQLHFKNWPDNGVADINSLLTLTSVKDEFTTDRNSPIIVHCSAGCGRTGVFITVDSIISAFKSNKQNVKSELDEKKHLSGVDIKDPNQKIDIWNTDIDLIYFTVQQLRKQRISMVQSLNQFIFCYEVILQFFYSLHNE